MLPVPILGTCVYVAGPFSDRATDDPDPGSQALPIGFVDEEGPSRDDDPRLSATVLSTCSAGRSSSNGCNGIASGSFCAFTTEIERKVPASRSP
jgi:hypothetical protein